MKTPLHLAALNNHADVINFLMTKGAKIEGISNKEIQKFAPSNSAIVMNNISPLLISSRKGHSNCFELLLDLGANLHETDVRGWNCLHFAAYNGHDDLVKKIIQFDQPEDTGIFKISNLNNSILLKQKNKQGHKPFDICKNERTKAWFRKKTKDDEDAIKRAFLELRKKKKLGLTIKDENKSPIKLNKGSKDINKTSTNTKKGSKEENKDSDDDYSDEEFEDDTKMKEKKVHVDDKKNKSPRDQRNSRYQKEKRSPRDRKRSKDKFQKKDSSEEK